jgi:hypothetical protein
MAAQSGRLTSKDILKKNEEAGATPRLLLYAGFTVICHRTCLNLSEISR